LSDHIDLLTLEEVAKRFAVRPAFRQATSAARVTSPYAPLMAVRE